MKGPTELLANRVRDLGVVILDGALATELEAKGHDLDHPLWSASVLEHAPQDIRAVHRAYLDAGSDCISSAGYQASVEGFERAGLSRTLAEELYRRSVRLCLEARADFVREQAAEDSHRSPLVAASFGPYAALLADGSEYTGYDASLSSAVFEEYHRPRIELTLEELAEGGTGRELLAFETIPSLREALVVAGLASEVPGLESWIAFSCRDGATTSEGQPLEECARVLADFPKVTAIGVNCTDPRHVPSLLQRLAGATDKLILCYPNSGETYDMGERGWTGERTETGGLGGDGPDLWRAAGASMIGGCCRTTPANVSRLVSWRDGL